MQAFLEFDRSNLCKKKNAVKVDIVVQCNNVDDRAEEPYPTLAAAVGCLVYNLHIDV